jgi:hypothetical protein
MQDGKRRNIALTTSLGRTIRAYEPRALHLANAPHSFCEITADRLTDSYAPEINVSNVGEVSPTPIHIRIAADIVK